MATSGDKHVNDDHKYFTTIQEGSATMSFPSDQESTVFYNPVQVQNRDLSILMISLYAERKALRKALASHKQQLLKENQSLSSDKKLSRAQIQAKIDEYEKTLDPTKLVKEESTAPKLTIFEALAASGLRSVRYWNEIPGVRHVTINDLEKAAIQRAHDNIRKNQLENVLLPDNVERKHGICINHGDATHELYLSRRPQQQSAAEKSDPAQAASLPKYLQQQQPMWDVVDLDPYGSAAPFLDGAIQAVESGGMLCVTCTDMAALGGSHPETAFGRYAALPIQSARYLQELALRILLHTMAITAAKYGRTIRPILSVGMAFYVRVFVEVYNDKKGVKDLSLQLGHVYQSTQCPTFMTLPHGQMGGSKGTVYQSNRLTTGSCPETGAPWKIGGPMWLGPLHDTSVVQTALERLRAPDSPEKSSPVSPNMDLIATRKRLLGLLTSVSEELETPLYYQVPDLARIFHVSSPSIQVVKAALVNAGYKVSGFHKEPQALKTDAPNHVVWDIMRKWVQENPPKKKPEPDSAAAKILKVEPTMQVDFTLPKKEKTKEKVTRFPLNPEKHWGPKRRAISSKDGPSSKKAKSDENPASEESVSKV